MKTFFYELSILMPSPSLPGGEYLMWVSTAEDSRPAHGGKATIVIYGDKGKSDDIELFAPSSTASLFEPANSDEFEVGLYFTKLSIISSCFASYKLMKPSVASLPYKLV